MIQHGYFKASNLKTSFEDLMWFQSVSILRPYETEPCHLKNCSGPINLAFNKMSLLWRHPRQPRRENA